jgi:hypothetical protein
VLAPRCPTFLLALLAASSPALAKDKGYAVAAVAIPADGQSSPVAVNTSRIAKETFAADSEISVLDMEKVLDGGEPIWLDKLTEAEADAKKGKNAKDSVELNVASDAFASAMVAYEQAVPGLKDMSAVVDTLVQQGTVFVLSGDARSGQQSFVRALTLDPGFRLPKDGTNKRVQTTFDAAVKDERAAGQGTLTVYSSTGAAEVWVDGVFRGVAPFTVDIAAGRHYVRVVRDGYLSFGAAAEVKRGAESSVQASLKPTAKLSKLEEATTRIAREPENDKNVADLAAALQVDKLVVVLVKDENGSALLNATMVDGVSGKVISKAHKVFASKDSFFEHDVHTFIDERIKNGIGIESTSGDPTPPPPPKTKDPSLLPGTPDKVETPVTVISGWVLVGTGSALAINTAVFGVISYQLYDAYRNKDLTPNDPRGGTQLDPNLGNVRNQWLTTSIVTDASWVVGGACLAGGIWALVNGYSEMSAREEVVNP